MDQLKQKMQDESYRLYAVSVSDRFSDLGLVGVIGISGHILDLFSLSCRALGREVERHMMAFVKKDEVKEYSYIPTIRNGEFYMDFLHE